MCVCVCVCVCVCNTCIYGSTANYNNDINNNNIKKRKQDDEIYNIIYYLLLHIIHQFHHSIGAKPAADYVGLRLFLTEKGFGYLESVAKQLILKDLQNITIPDVNFDKDGFKGSLSGLKMYKFCFGKFNIGSNKRKFVELDVMD